MKRYYSSGLETLGDREVGFCASTPQLARDGHVIVPSGIDLTNYRQNPVMLWSHIPENPVASATAIGLQGSNLIGRAEFAPVGASPLADEVFALVKSGIVRGVSVGFNPIEYEPLDPKRPRDGQRILRSELLEISFVSVPADTGASVIARSMGARAHFVSIVRALPRLPCASIQHAMAQITSVGGGLISPTIHVWALQQIEEEKRGAYSYEQRQADLTKFRRVGVEPEQRGSNGNRPIKQSWSRH